MDAWVLDNNNNNNQLYLGRVTHNSNSTDELVALHPKTINTNTINYIPKLWTRIMKWDGGSGKLITNG